MEKRFSFYGKTLLMLFLMCLVTGSAFADLTPKNVKITPDESNPDKIYTSATGGFDFTATLLSEVATLQDNVADFTPVTLVDAQGKQVMTVNVSSGSITLAENNYFTDKTVPYVDAYFKFAAGAWASTHYTSREYTMSEAIRVYDSAELNWGAMSYTGNNAIVEGTTSLPILFTAKGKKSGVALEIEASGYYQVRVTGLDVDDKTVNNYYTITGTDGNFVINPSDLIQNKSDNYTLLINAGAFSVKYDDGYEAGESSAYNSAVKNLEVIAKANIKPEDDTKYVFDASDHSFSFVMTEGFEDDNRYAVSGKALTYNEGTVDKPTAISATGTTSAAHALAVEVTDNKTVKVSLTEPDLFVADNAITVTIPEGAFTVNGQKNKAQTLTFTPKDIVWDTPTADAISDKDKDIVVKFGAMLGEGYENIELETGKMVYVTVGTAAAVPYAPTIDNDNHTIKVTLADAITTVNEATITIPAGTFKSNNSTNSAASCTVAVKPSIKFPTAVSEMSEIDDNAKELTFKLNVLHGTAPADFTLDASLIKIDGTAVSTAEVVTPGTATSTPATVKVTFDNALSADLHTLTLEKNAIIVTNSFETSSEITKDFEVLDHVNFTVAPTISDATAIKFTISGKNAYDEVKKVNSALSGTESAVTIDGKVYKATTSTSGNDLVYRVDITEEGPAVTTGTLPCIKLSDVAAWETTPATYSIAANLIKSENTLSAALEGTLAVDKIDPQITTVAADNSFDVYVGPKAFTLKNSLDEEDYEFATLPEGVSVATIEQSSTNAQFVTVTLEATKTLEANKTYTLTFKPGAIIVTNGTCNFSDVVLTVSTDKVLNFDDANTVASQVPVSSDETDLYTVNYKRSFKNSYYQGWCAPFDVKPSQFDAAYGLTFLKLTAITEDEGILNFHYNTVASDATVHAGRPYIVYAANATAEAPVNVEQEIANVKLKDISNENDRYVESSTTSTTFGFQGTVEAVAMGEAPASGDPTIGHGKVFYRLSQNYLLATENATDGVKAWRWYMTTDASLINYARVIVDGEDDATGINSVDADNTNVANSEIYNLAGQRMSQMSTGVNIVNGKKVLVK